jgi:hypothetical protein
MMTYCRHYKCRKCRILATSVASVTSYSHLAYVVSRTTSQGTLEDTLRDWLKKEKSFDKEYKAFSLRKTT